MSAADLALARRQLEMASIALEFANLPGADTSMICRVVDTRLQIVDHIMEIHAEDPSEDAVDDAEDIVAPPSPKDRSQRFSEPLLPGVDRGILCNSNRLLHVGHWVWCSGIPGPEA